MRTSCSRVVPVWGGRRLAAPPRNLGQKRLGRRRWAPAGKAEGILSGGAKAVQRRFGENSTETPTGQLTGATPSATLIGDREDGHRKGFAPSQEAMNKSEIGHRTLMKVMAALYDLGKAFYLPFGDHGRVDSFLKRKTAACFECSARRRGLPSAPLVFPTSSIDSRVCKGRTLRRGYRGEADFFGVYCPAINRVYLVPVEDVPVNEARLRLTRPKNNQKAAIRWASDYEIGAVAQLGERTDGIRKVTGSTPVSST